MPVVVTLLPTNRRRVAGTILAVALRVLASAAALALVALHPYVPGEWLELRGEPHRALEWFRCTPSWLVSHERLDGLRAETDVESFEQRLTTGGARVRFDPLVWRVAGALRMGQMADSARARAGELLGRELPPVNVRLPRWEDDCLLGAFDYLDVNLSPAAARNPLVVAHEVAHFAWFHTHLARLGLPVSSPLWLEEGLADYSAAEAAGPVLMRRLRQVPAARAGSLETLDRQVGFDNDYREAAGFVRYLVERRGVEPFRAFVRAMRLGTPTWEALGRGYGQWPEDLIEEYAREGDGHRRAAEVQASQAGTERPLGGAAPEPPPGVKFTPGPPGGRRELDLRAQARVLGSAAQAATPLLMAGSRAGHRSWQGSGDSVPGSESSSALRLIPTTDRRLPPLGSTLLVVVLIAVGWAAGRRWPGLAAGRVLRCWAPMLALAALLGNRLLWGVVAEQAPALAGLDWLVVPYLWRHRLLWLGDTLLLGVAVWWWGERRGATAAGPRGWGASAGAGMFAAVVAGMAALTAGAVALVPARPPDVWLAASVAVLGLKAALEARFFLRDLPGRAERRGGRWLGAAAYSLWVLGLSATPAAYLTRVALLVAAGRLAAPGAALAGWDLVAGVVLSREAMAPAKLGLLAGLGADGLDGWWPVAAAGLAGLLFRAARGRSRPT